MQHVEGWFRVLAARNSETRAALQRASQEALAATLEWLGPDSQPLAGELAHAGVVNTSWDRLRQLYLEWLGTLAAASSVSLPIERRVERWWATAAVNQENRLPQMRRYASMAATLPAHKGDEQLPGFFTRVRRA